MAAICVAVGVIRNRAGQILLARRADKVHQGGLWEFPGGKVEPGETTHQALQRELTEELGIQVTTAQPLIRVHHQYPELAVCLDVWEVTEFTGEPVGNEGQPLTWVAVANLADYPLPAANTPIVTALQLPPMMVVTGAFDSPLDFQERLTGALTAPRLVYLRPHTASPPTKHPTITDELITEAVSICVPRQSPLMLNSDLVTQSVLAKHLLDSGQAGLHLTASALTHTTQRPAVSYLGASCHNLEELQQAAALAVDYVTLSPVSATDSHSQATPLGWQAFADLVEAVNMPVYALGGLGPEDLPLARRWGGQGVAGIRGFWGQ